LAAVLKLYDGTNTVDLADSSNIMLLRRRYVPQVATPPGDGSIPSYVVESIPVRVRAANANGLATALQGVHAMQKLAAEYWADQAQNTPVWLHQQLDGETGERRALVRRIEIVPQSWLDEPAPEMLVPVELRVERHPYWERTAALTFNPATEESSPAFMHDYTGGSAADVVGDVSARVKVKFSNTENRVWAGFRSAARHGTPANFEYLWECEDGNNNGNETGISDTSDVTASASYRVTVSESDLNWDGEEHMCLYIRLSDITTNYSDQFGSFVWLLRAMVTAGTWRVHLRWAYGNTDPDVGVGSLYVSSEKVDFDNDTWDLVEMGICDIPIRDLKAITISDQGASADSNFLVEIWAERVSGSGNLYLDCLCLIPRDEGYIASGPTRRSSTAVWVYCSPRDEFTDIQASAAPGFADFVPLAPENFYAPLGDGRLVVAFAQSAASYIDDVLDFEGTYFPRWLSLRGAE